MSTNCTPNLLGKNIEHATSKRTHAVRSMVANCVEFCSLFSWNFVKISKRFRRKFENLRCLSKQASDWHKFVSLLKVDPFLVFILCKETLNLVSGLFTVDKFLARLLYRQTYLYQVFRLLDAGKGFSASLALKKTFYEVFRSLTVDKGLALVLLKQTFYQVFHLPSLSLVFYL